MLTPKIRSGLTRQVSKFSRSIIDKGATPEQVFEVLTTPTENVKKQYPNWQEYQRELLENREEALQVIAAAIGYV